MSTPNLQDEIVQLLNKHRQLDGYQNPHLVRGILEVLKDVYGIQDDLLDDWCEDLWSM